MPAFVDTAKITVKAGNCGNGAEAGEETSSSRWTAICPP